MSIEQTLQEAEPWVPEWEATVAHSRHTEEFRELSGLIFDVAKQAGNSQFTSGNTYSHRYTASPWVEQSSEIEVRATRIQRPTDFLLFKLLTGQKPPKLQIVEFGLDARSKDQKYESIALASLAVSKRRGLEIHKYGDSKNEYTVYSEAAGEEIIDSLRKVAEHVGTAALSEAHQEPSAR